MWHLSLSLLFLVIFIKSAHASPWTLPRGELVLSAGFNYLHADQEFIESGGPRNFPINGVLDSSTLVLGLRAGLTNRFELELKVPLSVINYKSDPVILLEQPEDDPRSPLDFSQDNIIDLSRRVVGVADFRIIGRYGWRKRPFAITSEIELKVPTGYERPAGTFGERPTSEDEFLGDLRRFVRSENVRDDVTLGDGQLDLKTSILFGWMLPTRTFLRSGLGYNLRLGNAGDQFTAALKLGQVTNDDILLYVGGRLEWTLMRGRPIGVGISAIDPDLPAEDYGGVTNLLLRQITLDRNALNVGGGIIFRLTPRLELNLGYERTLIGRNISAINSFSISFAFRAQTRRSLR